MISKRDKDRRQSQDERVKLEFLADHAVPKEWGGRAGATWSDL